MAEKIIDGVKFRAEKLDAETSFKLKIRIMKLIGPGFKGLAEMLAGGSVQEAVASLSGDSDISGLFTAAQDMIEGLEPDQAWQLISDIVSHAQTLENQNWNDVVMGHHIQELNTAYQVAFFVLKVNYADFFPAKAMKLLAAKKSPA